MVDAGCLHEEHNHPNEKHEDPSDHGGIEDAVEEVGNDEGDDHDEAHDEGTRELAKGSSDGVDEHPAMAIFGEYRQLGSYMMGLSGRLKTMLNNIKPTADPTTRLVTLQELSELLSISTEDTLAGSFQVESYIRELVRILGGTGGDPDEGDDEDQQENDEDAALAAALAMSTGGGAYHGDENLEAQVLACRCLANLMEALPGVAHTVVYHGAIPVLCSKLIEISYIDLAEQTLSVSMKFFLGVIASLHLVCRLWRRYQRNFLAQLFERVVWLLCSTILTSSLSLFKGLPFKPHRIAVVTSHQSIFR